METESEIRAEPHSRQAPEPGKPAHILVSVWAVVRNSSQRSHRATCGGGQEGSASPCSEGRGHNTTPKQEDKDSLEI